MSPARTRHIALTAAAIAVSMVLAACGSVVAAPAPEGLVVAGTVQDRVASVTAPAVTTPTVDVQAGINKARLPAPPGLHSSVLTDTAKAQQKAAAAAQQQQQAAASTAALTRTPRVAGRLAAVYVRVGDRVKRGRVVARLDDSLLLLGVKKAEADATKARADIDVLDARIDDLEDKREELLDARRKVHQGLATLAKAKAQLKVGQAQLKAGLAQFKRQQAAGMQKQAAAMRAIAQLKAQIAQLERLPVPPQAQIAKLKAQLGALTLQLARGRMMAAQGAAQAQAKSKAAQLKLAAAAKQIAVGETKARAALRQIQRGLRLIDDAIDKLERARKVAVAALPVRDAAVRTAKDRAAQAAIVSPVEGTVVAALHAGEVVMTGAPVIKVRTAGPSLVDTYVTLDQLPDVKPATAAVVTLDSLPGREFAAKVQHVDPDYAFPPSAFPTSEVHLLRAVKVTLALEDDQTLPAGTPVDVRFPNTR